MSDFYGALESTSFRVRDIDAFLADPDVQWLKDHAKEDGFFDENYDGYFNFGWYGLYPSTVLQDVENYGANDEWFELDICTAIQRHILPGDVCQIGVSGNEKLRYIGGDIRWVTSKGIVDFAGVTEWSQKLTEESLRDFIGNLSTQLTALAINQVPRAARWLSRLWSSK
jgi:hypothetical protein